MEDSVEASGPGASLSPRRLSALRAAVADVIADFLRPGDDLEFIAGRHGVSVVALRHRVAAKEAAEKRWKALLERVQGHLPEGSDPWDWQTPEELSRLTGDPVDEVRSAMNSRAHALLQPATWQQWVSFRDRERSAVKKR